MNRSLNWNSEDKLDITIKVIAFLVSPILGLLTSLLKLNTRSSYLIFFLSSIFIGLSINIPEDNIDLNFDSITYREQFETTANMNSTDIMQIISNYQKMSGDQDIYASLLFFLVGRISDNYHVCFMAIALIFVIFMLKSLRFFVADSNYRTTFLCLLLLFLFTICQIPKINAFRFYTAYWIALYAFFNIIQVNKKGYWALLILTPLVHASFLVTILIMIMYYIMRSNHKFAIFVVVVSILVSPFAIDAVSWAITHLPESLGGHYSAYINEWYIKKVNSGTGLIWTVRLMELLVRLSVNAIVLFFAWKYHTHIANSKCNKLYFLLLAILAFINFTFMIPSVGSRFVMFTFPLIAYIWLVCFMNDHAYRWIIVSFSALYLFFFLFLPWNIYQIPCFNFYTLLWNADVIYESPLYLAIKYIVLY